MGEREILNLFLKYGTIIVILTTMLVQTSGGLEALYGKEYSLMDFHIIEWIMNLVVLIFTTLFTIFLIVDTLHYSTNQDLFMLILRGIYIVTIIFLGISYVFANNYGLPALIISLIFIVVPCLYQKNY